jgi:LPS sulfotransferase NodH
MKYALCCLPRSGSFLASQLLEEYAVNKYGYGRSPFYEFLCTTTLKNTNGFIKAKIKNGELIAQEGIKKERDPNVEIANRLELIDRQAKKGKYYLNKIIYRSSPITTMQYLARNGYYFGFIERRDMLAQVVSHVVASKTNKWHHDANNRNFNFGKDETEFVWKAIEIKKDFIDQKVFFLKDMRDYYNWVNHSVVYYEDFKDDYGVFFEQMGLDDYKDVLPDFEFIKSKPTKKFEPEDIIKNYDEVKQWIVDAKKQLQMVD